MKKKYQMLFLVIIASFMIVRVGNYAYVNSSEPFYMASDIGKLTVVDGAKYTDGYTKAGNYAVALNPFSRVRVYIHNKDAAIYYFYNVGFGRV